MFDWLILIVLEALCSLSIETLLRIETIGSGIPHIPQMVNIIGQRLLFLLDNQLTFSDWITDCHITDACFVKNLLHFSFLVVAHLNHHTWILCEKHFHEVRFSNSLQVHIQTTLLISEGHFQQSSDESTRTDVVTCQQQLILHKFLHCQERIAEIFRILHRWHIAAHLAQTLRKGRATEAELVETEIYMIECCVCIVHQDRTYHLLHVAYLTARAHNHRSWAHNLRTVRIFLRHGEGILTRWHVHLQCTAEVAQRFHTCIEASILTLLRAARPHPVGREAHAVETISHWCPNEVCQ